MKSTKPILGALGVLAAASAVAASGGGGGTHGDVAAAASGGRSSSTQGLPQGSEPVNLKPSDFTTDIDNPYWPMRPGSRWVYREGDTAGTGEMLSLHTDGAGGRAALISFTPGR